MDENRTGPQRARTASVTQTVHNARSQTPNLAMPSSCQRGPTPESRLARDGRAEAHTFVACPMSKAWRQHDRHSGRRMLQKVPLILVTSKDPITNTSRTDRCVSSARWNCRIGKPLVVLDPRRSCDVVARHDERTRARAIPAWLGQPTRTTPDQFAPDRIQLPPSMNRRVLWLAAFTCTSIIRPVVACAPRMSVRATPSRVSATAHPRRDSTEQTQCSPADFTNLVSASGPDFVGQPRNPRSMRHFAPTSSAIDAPRLRQFGS